METQEDEEGEPTVFCMENGKAVSLIHGDLTMHYFLESDEANSLIDALPSLADPTALEGASERFSTILDRYQEKPHLLDSHLEGMVGKLIKSACTALPNSETCHQSFKYLARITKVRGHKYITRLLPHETADVEPVLGILSKQDPADHERWETRYMLLIWLSALILSPLDMSRLDGARTSGSSGETVTERILGLAKLYLTASDKSRDAAALLLSKFVSRPDIKGQHLPSVIDWLFKLGNGVDIATVSGVTAVNSALTALAALFKHCHREDIHPFAVPVMRWMNGVDLLKSNNTLLRKLAIKLIQRLGLALMPAKLCSWRYKRGFRSLAQGLAGGTLAQGTPVEEQKDASEAKEEYADVPEEMEEVLETLLTGLRDKDTVVRWSAAKGVGRVTARLPQEMADEVVGFVLQLFSQREGDGAWHGGCLALAELGRRGLLLPSRLKDVVPVVVRALAYDEQRGSYSVGSHVRDAACYVCWSFARAYDPGEIKPYVQEIASALVVAMVFDREVNCRRAASAAFQENVGRQGTFPHGIDIVTLADYFAVGNRSDVYLKISTAIAQYEEYRRPLIDHLVDTKLLHWDAAVRTLAASALHSLTPTAPDYVVSHALPALLPRAVSINLTMRHGSLMAIGEVCLALHKLCPHTSGRTTVLDWIGKDALQTIEGIVSRLTQGNMFRGVNGSNTRFAACRMIETLSRSQLPVSDQTVESWRALVDECIPHVDHADPWIQECAVAALTPLVSQHYCLPDGSVKVALQESLVDSYCRELENNSVYARMGFASALSVLPRPMLRGKAKQIISCLVKAAVIEKGKESEYAEARSHALKAIAKVCETAGLATDAADSCSLPAVSTVPLLFETYLTALQDYTTDSRGDVGTWVREAALAGLETLTLAAAQLHSGLLDRKLVTHVIGGMLQQASEKIDRTRAIAGHSFARLLHSKSPEIPDFPYLDELRHLFSEEVLAKLNWSSAADTFPLLVQVLALSSYRHSVLLGMLISVGGLTESLVRHSSASLLAYLQKVSADQRVSFAAELIAVFKAYQKNDRVTVSLLKSADLLLSNGCLEAVPELPDGASFPAQFLDLCKKEVSGSGDARKLITSVPVFCGLLQFAAIRLSCLQQLTILLGHKYPRVRRTTADQLYVTMVTYDELVDPANMDEILLILSETAWDGDLAPVRQVRNNLCQLLGVPAPKPVQRTATAKPSQAAAKQDTMSSYRDLVDRAGY